MWWIWRVWRYYKTLPASICKTESGSGFYVEDQIVVWCLKSVNIVSSQLDRNNKSKQTVLEVSNEQNFWNIMNNRCSGAFMTSETIGAFRYSADSIAVEMKEWL